MCGISLFCVGGGGAAVAIVTGDGGLISFVGFILMFSHVSNMYAYVPTIIH